MRRSMRCPPPRARSRASQGAKHERARVDRSRSCADAFWCAQQHGPGQGAPHTRQTLPCVPSAVLDDQTLAIPDRTGNKRVDTMLNLMENPRIGALFLVPGVNETLRVNGRVRISLESDLLAGMAVNGKLPNAATLIDIEEVYFQCAKAILRSDLWNPNKRVPRGTFPSLGRVLADQIKGAEAGQLEQAIEERYRTSLY